MVGISKQQMEQWIEKYEVYVDKIINHTYYYLKPEKKEEFRQAGRIGLWKGIQRYYARKPDTFNQKIFIDTICAYIRYEMKRLFADSGLIHLNAKQYRNFKGVEKLKNCSFDISEECLKKLAAENGYRYDWYLKAQQMMKTVSLDQPMSDEDGGDLYRSVVYDGPGFKTLIDQNYLAWIVKSALAGIKSDRDKALIRSWLSGIYCGRERNQ